jgi:hypothetical protein
MKVADAIATWWIRNAEIRHGHIPAIGNVEMPAGTATTAASGGESLLKKSIPLIAGTVLGAGGLAGLPSLLEWWQWSPPVAQAPADIPAPPAIEKTGSLYQYLEDRGDHLP